MWWLPPLRPNFSAALRDVSASKTNFRLAAAARLGDAPDDELGDAIDGLLKLARDKDARIRARACESLGELGREHAKALSDDDSERSLRELELSLDDGFGLVRSAAIDAFAEFGEVGLEKLESQLGNVNEDIAAESLDVLAPRKDLDSQSWDKLKKRGPEVRRAVVRNAPIGQLSAFSADSDEYSRLVANIRRFDHDGLQFSDIEAGLSRPELRFDVLRTLIAFPRKDAVAALQKLISWRHPELVRIHAATALAAANEYDGINYVAKRLRRRWSAGRIVALSLIDEFAIDAFAGTLNDLARKPRGLDVSELKAISQRLTPAR